MANPLLFEGGSLRISRRDVARLRAGEMPEQMFFEAVMARVEVNKNRDEITAEHLREVAGSLAHTPIDDDHKQPVLQGHIISARFDPGLGALIASCVMSPRRFPDIATGLLAGTVKFSIESAAEEVSCSSCGTHFSTTVPESGYCACLQARKVTLAASRRWHSNRGIGAAFTTNPAGSDCAILDGTVSLVASYDEAESPDEVEQMLTASAFGTDPGTATPPPISPEAKETPVTPEKLKELLTAAVAAHQAGQPLAANTDEERAVKAAVEALAAHSAAQSVAAVAEAVSAKETALTAEHQTALSAAVAEGERNVLAERRVAALKELGVADADDKRSLVASMSDEVFAFASAGYATQVAAATNAPTHASTPATPATPPADPATPAVGAQLLANAAQGATVQTPAQPTGTAGSGNAAPTSLMEFSLTRKRA